MAYTHKDGSGSLFRNEKGENPARPDYRGDLMVGGVLYEISSWIKPLPSDASKKFMSLSAKPKQERQAPPAVKQAPKSGGFDDMSDCPF